jgi:N-acetylated-alpha-linked acidic dipeptidase
MLNGVAKSVNDPESNVSAWKRMQAQSIAEGKAEARTRADQRIGALGSGSDFSPFLQHLGIASINMGYGGEDDGGIYHSAYDDFYWYTHFSDSTFVYGRALAQTAGITVMRLASADVLPFAFSNFVETAQGYAKELQDLRDARAKQITDRARAKEEGVYAVINDPRNPLLPPKTEAPPPRFEFTPVLNALDDLTRASDEFEKQYGTWSDRAQTGAATNAADAVAYKALNEQLIQAERALTSPEGLPNRSWYQHLVYAPGFYTGYGVKTMPAAREAIEQSQWSAVNGELLRIAAALQRQATVVKNAAASLAKISAAPVQ